MKNEIRLDLAHFTPAATNDALEMLFKARYNGDEDADWTGDESPFLKRIISTFLQRGKSRLNQFRDDMNFWLFNKRSTRTDNNPRPAIKDPSNWSEDEIEAVEYYLEMLGMNDWTLQDHMMSVDLGIQKWLNPLELADEAEWLSTKATIFGKVAANWTGAGEPTEIDGLKLLNHVPSSMAEMETWYPLPVKEKSAMEYAIHHAAENVVNLSDGARKQMREIVARHVHKQQSGDNSGPSLQSELLDTFGELNRDWNRIAVTEAGECFLQGMIGGMQPGTKVKRVEHYDTACPFCKKIHGVIATVVSADHPNKDPDTMIWPGKNNIGRAAAPRKRVGGALIPRGADEMWWLPAGLAHPHCRGSWVRVPDTGPDSTTGPEDPEFAALVAEYLA